MLEYAIRIDNKYYSNPSRLNLIIGRKKLDLSNRGLAKMAKISPCSISTAEVGGSLGVNNAKLIANIIGIKYWEVLETFQYDDENKQFVGEDGTIYQVDDVKDYVGVK